MDDIITEIREDKRGAVVRVNGEELLWFSRSIWAERSLQEGEEVSLTELKQWLLPRQYREALNEAVRLLAVRVRSGYEVRKRLEAKRYMEETIDMVLYKLEKEQLLDDEAFAREWALARSHRQIGKERILQELRMKGVGREAAEQAVNELPEDECEDQAVKLADKFLRRYADEDAKKAMSKVMAAMARRGYSFEDAREAVSRAIRNLSEDQ